VEIIPLLSASKCFKNEVRAEDNTLGNFVNIIFDKESLEARMLVFPNLGKKRLMTQAVRSLGIMGRSAISSATHGLSDVIGPASSIVDDLTNEGVSQTEQKMGDITRELARTYFLVPVSEISIFERKTINLDNDSEYYDLYKNMSGTRNDLAFFNDDLYRDQEMLVKISLNCLPIRGLSVRDQGNNKARILDIYFEPIRGITTHLHVKPVGKGKKPRFVETESLNLMDLTLSKKIEEFPIEIDS
jgi:hypothetical protein